MHQADLIIEHLHAYLHRHLRKELLQLLTSESVDDGKKTGGPLIWKAVRLIRVSVRGMSYLAESGLFTAYKPLSGRFVPFDKSWAAAC